MTKCKACEEERKLIVRFLHDTAKHWRQAAERLMQSENVNHRAVAQAEAKCAVLEGVAADIQDSTHMRHRGYV